MYYTVAIIGTRLSGLLKSYFLEIKLYLFMYLHWSRFSVLLTVRHPGPCVQIGHVSNEGLVKSVSIANEKQNDTRLSIQ